MHIAIVEVARGQIGKMMVKHKSVVSKPGGLRDRHVAGASTGRRHDDPEDRPASPDELGMLLSSMYILCLDVDVRLRRHRLLPDDTCG